MHLSRTILNVWAAKRHAAGQFGTTLVKLSDDDTMDRSTVPAAPYLSGPTIVALTSFQDGGWSAGPAAYETPESIYWSTM